MGKILAQHWPHFGIVAVGVVVFLWVAYRPEKDAGAPRVEDPAPVPAPWPEPWPASAPAPSVVRRSVARRGLLALGPLLGAVATGAILYGVGVAGDVPSNAVIWIHTGISALALLLVVYKVADMGLARVRRAFSRQHLHELVSIVLGALAVPLLVTGVALLLDPSSGSVMAYLHLISSAWWTGLLVWHLRRYLGASVRAAFRRQPPARAGRTVPRSAPAVSVPRSDPRPSRPA